MSAAALPTLAQDPDLPVDDLGPLAWVMEELRKSLEGSAAALRRFVREAAAGGLPDAGALRQSRQQLHQSVGALEMVGLTAPAQLLRAMEQAVQRFIERPVLCDEAAVNRVERAGFAVADYLDGVLHGKPQQPVALFPQYREVLALWGADRIHPADLWPFDWQWVEVPDLGTAQPPEGAAIRARLDQAVLRVVKSGDPAAAGELATVCAGLSAAPGPRESRGFWAVAAGYFEGLALGLLPCDVYAKRAASRVLLQYAQLARGEPGVSERLALDLAFFCAQAVPASPRQAPRLAAVREAWRLDRHVPVDYEQERYGRFDPGLLAQVRKRLAAAREGWSALAGGDTSRLRSTGESFAGLCESLTRLHPPLALLARSLQAVAGDAMANVEAPSPARAMEAATAILFLEALLQDFDPSDAGLASRADQLAHRLDGVRRGDAPGPLEPWMETLYRHVSDRQSMGSVVGELRAALAELERDLDAFFRQPADRAPLGSAPGHLSQMRGVLSVLGLDQAVRAVVAMREAVQAILSSAPGEPPSGVDRLGNNLGALGLLVDMLGYQPALARKLFLFDEALGELRPVMGRVSAPPEPPPEPPLQPALAEALPEWGDLPELVDVADPAQPLAAARLDPAHEVPSAPGLDAPAESLDALPAPSPAEPPGDGMVAGTDAPPEAAAVSAPASVPGPVPADDVDDEAELLSIFLAEAHEVITAGRAALASLADSPADLEALTVLRRAFHTLKGSSRMVGLQALGEAAWALEQVLNGWLAEQRPATGDLCALADRGLEGLAAWVADIEAGRPHDWTASVFEGPAQAFLAGGGLAPASVSPGEASPPGILEALARDEPPGEPACEPGDWVETIELGELSERGERDQPESSGPCELADPPSPPSPPPSDSPPLPEAAGVSQSLMTVYLGEADDWSLRLLSGVAAWSEEPGRAVPSALTALAHSLAGSSATVGFGALSSIARRLEDSFELARSPGAASGPHVQAWTDAAEEIRRLLHQFAAGLSPEPRPEVLAALEALEAPAGPAVPAFPAREDLVAKPPPDRDLFPFFEEEALELLPALGGALRQWHGQPGSPEPREAALRLLHTLKGGARLAGALALGEQAHALESRIEALEDAVTPEDVHPLLQAFDELQAAFDTVREPPAAREAAAVAAMATEAPSPPAPADVREPATDGTTGAPQAAATPLLPPLATTPPPRAAGHPVRVNSQLLDRLMNQTGEVMISRSRLASEVRHLRAALQDLTGNLDRLRGQLRDVELQAELQMQSRLALAREAAAGFDPLEFDRFTRVQELTRMMAESVDDVATVQRTLQRTVEAAEDGLAAQARQTRELQRDLLRTRMVEFESIADRLHRVVRLAATDAGKQVALELAGASIEMDRGVLDRMTPAFEHLLRNAVAHGIEAPPQRAAAGKPATGSIRIALAQAGNDVSVEFEDDGAGLQMDRIREKAVALGLWPADAPLGEGEAGELIFTPGFSTAGELTELAGRGVGMDVVRAEVRALGGRIETVTRSGQGTRFRLVLPLTTAVTQVVMVRCGALSFGVPAHLVEIIHRATPDEVAHAAREGVLLQAGERLPFHWGGALLLASRRSGEVPGRSIPVLILRSADQRLALQVDEVPGHQEVVVKHLGPQLARLPGLAGMTVLASGAVVLIYNPVALASVYGAPARAWELAEGPGEGAPGQPGAAPAEAPLVLVVDDSITVRRVTQRLLQREGFRVALAADGLQALERLAQERPVVVLSDIEMPRMDGFDLVRNLRGDPRWSDLPVVMITSRIAQKHRDHAAELGVDHYLGKPYAEEELLALVRQHAAGAAAASPAARPAS